MNYSVVTYNSFYTLRFSTYSLQSFYRPLLRRDQVATGSPSMPWLMQGFRTMPWKCLDHVDHSMEVSVVDFSCHVGLCYGGFLDVSRCFYHHRSIFGILSSSGEGRRDRSSSLRPIKRYGALRLDSGHAGHRRRNKPPALHRPNCQGETMVGTAAKNTSGRGNVWIRIFVESSSMVLATCKHHAVCRIPIIQTCWNPCVITEYILSLSVYLGSSIYDSLCISAV